MDAALPFDFSSSIRYALTPRPGPGGRIEIVLDLFRGATPALTWTIASVRASQVAPLRARCRRHLEHHGAHAVTHAAPAPEPAPAWTAPVAAFDWMFAG